MRRSAHLPGFRQNRQVCIQNLAELHATGFLAGIVGTCGASGVHKENVRFLGGRKLYNSEMSHQPSGGIRIARPQSQQGESVSVNADKLAPNAGYSQADTSTRVSAAAKFTYMGLSEGGDVTEN